MDWILSISDLVDVALQSPFSVYLRSSSRADTGARVNQVKKVDFILIHN